MDNTRIKMLESVAERTLELSFSYSEDDVIKGNKEARRWLRWDWSIGVAFYGLIKVYRLTNNRGYLSIMKRWIDERLEKGNPPECVNTCALLIPVLELYQDSGEEKYARLLNSFDDYIFNKAVRTPCGAISHSVLEGELEGQIWADTLFMSIIYLAKRGISKNKQEYIAEAEKQLSLHFKKLFDQSTGLFYHGWDDIKGSPMGVKWGRGNAWVNISIVEILSITNHDFKERVYLLNLLSKQLKALSELQDDTGMWRTVVDSPSTYLETSVTAGIAFGVLKGIKQGFVDSCYSNMANKALEAVLGNIDTYGNVFGGSTGTPIKENAEEYNKVPLCVTPFTQGLAMMALTEGLKS